jgi:hypothetical protein
MPAKETHSADPPPDSRSKQTVRSMARARWLDSVPLAATVRFLSTEYWRSPAKVHSMPTHWTAPKHSIDSVPRAATVRSLSTEYWRSPAKEHWTATEHSLGSVPPVSPKHSMVPKHSIPTEHSAPIHHHHHFHLVLCS